MINSGEESFGEIVCDVQELPPPEPMERILELLPKIEPGEYVRMLHRMEPVPLYAVVAEMGFIYKLYLDGDAPYEIIIYKKGDVLAQDRVDSFI